MYVTIMHALDTILWCEFLLLIGLEEVTAAWSSASCAVFGGLRLARTKTTRPRSRPTPSLIRTVLSTTTTTTAQRHNTQQSNIWLHQSSHEDSVTLPSPQVVGVVAPLTLKGPYPCLALRFPQLKSLSNDDENNDSDKETAVLNFAMDTGANINVVDPKVVDQWCVPRWKPSGDAASSSVLSSILSEQSDANASVSVLGLTGTNANATMALYNLGNCTLDGLPPEQADVTFLSNLTTFSRPCPVQTDGVLGIPFFTLFPAGVELDWYGTDGDPPTVIFYLGRPPNAQPPESALVNMTCIPLQPLSMPSSLSSMLPLPMVPSSSSLSSMRMGVLAVPMKIQHVMTLDDNSKTTTMIPFWALLDTGAPATILSHELATRAGIVPDDHFAVQIAGSDATRTETAVSKQRVSLFLVPSANENGNVNDDNNDNQNENVVSLGSGRVLMGNLSVLEALSGAVPPVQAVLGLDFVAGGLYRVLLQMGGGGAGFVFNDNNQAAADPPRLWVQELSDDLPRYRGE